MDTAKSMTSFDVEEAGTNAPFTATSDEARVDASGTHQTDHATRLQVGAPYVEHFSSALRNAICPPGTRSGFNRQQQHQICRCGGVVHTKSCQHDRY